MANFRTEAKMFPLVEAWQHSGQTQKVFCAEHDLSVSGLTYWLRRYCDYHAELSDESVSFIPLHYARQSLAVSAGEIPVPARGNSHLTGKRVLG